MEAAKPHRSMGRHSRKGYAPESRLTVSEWANKYDWLSQRASAEARAKAHRQTSSTPRSPNQILRAAPGAMSLFGDGTG
jgi:hypothetical protein